jgi:hypothetical protein
VIGSAPRDNRQDGGRLAGRSVRTTVRDDTIGGTVRYGVRIDGDELFDPTTPPSPAAAAAS